MSLDLATIRAVVAAAQGADDELMAIVDALTPLTNRHCRSKLCFEHENLEVRVGTRGRFARVIARLAVIAPLKLSIAPVVRGLISTDERDVVVLDYWAVPGEERVAKEPLRRYEEAAYARFIGDLRRLVDAGWVHPWALRASHRLGNKTGVITVDDWVMVSPAESEEELVATIRSRGILG